MTKEFLNKHASKRGRESPEKAYRPKKQSKISNYWLGSAEPTHANNSNRFEIFNTIDQDNIIDQIREKQPKPLPIFIDSISNIKPLYDLLNEVAKELYDLKIINSD